MPGTPPHPRRLLSVLLLLPLLLAACGDSPSEPEPDPVVSGSWTGTSQGIMLNLTLSEGVGGTVSGSGNLSGTQDNLALTVRQGTGASGYEDMNCAGRLLAEDEIAGTLNGSGFDDFNLNLQRR